jgi:hypothetical protein
VAVVEGREDEEAPGRRVFGSVDMLCCCCCCCDDEGMVGVACWSCMLKSPFFGICSRPDMALFVDVANVGIGADAVARLLAKCDDDATC